MRKQLSKKDEIDIQFKAWKDSLYKELSETMLNNKTDVKQKCLKVLEKYKNFNYK